MTDTEMTTAHDASDHGSDKKYVMVALILAVITAIEVFIYYHHPSEGATNTMLIVLSALKFVMVAMFFMHLKYDNRILRRLFFGGLTLAFSVYIVVLLLFGVFIR